MVPLNFVGEGQYVVIVSLNAGHDILKRLREMGLSVGDRIRVIHNAEGPLIVGKGNLRIALGRGMSFKIYVRHISESELCNTE